ncbi:helix-turn-helix transcriptional regulator [Mesorhizobium sp. M0306]|uniref:helix-turn-helix transcriptional regulator n=1 Tax=Mesorhizobium sp. M0306 TaxID=2956932 RepID=UPI003336FE4C
MRGMIDGDSGAPARSHTVSPHTLSELIGSIYDCALDPSHWERTLAEITQAMSGESAILSLNDLRHDRLLIEKSVGWGQLGFEERQKHIPEIHARLSEWLAKGPSLDDPFVASRQLQPDYLEKSPYVQRCLKPLGIVDVMHQFLVYTPSHFSELVIGRHERHGLITDREVEIVALLLPHLRRAVTVSNVLDAHAIGRVRMADALDALRIGVVLTNGEGSILHANRSAERMLQDGTAVQGTSGILSAKAPAASRELRRAIRLAARDEVMLGKTGLAIRLTGPPAPPVLAHVMPMNGSELRTRLQPEAVAAVFIGPSMTAAFDMTPVETKEYLRRRFGLTNAEADVALEVVKGDGRAAAGARLGITATTVRAHLSHIFEKTGVRRQAELVRLLMQAECELTGAAGEA